MAAPSKVDDELAIASSIDRMNLHRERFRQHRGGMTFEDIAKVENPNAKGKALTVLTREVENSVKVVQAYRTYATAQEVETNLHDTLVATADAEKKMLLEALKATQVQEVEEGKLERVPDWDVRFRAAELLNTKYGIAAKKGGGGLQIGVAVNNAPAQATKSAPVEPSVSVITSFEDVLRGVRAKQQQAQSQRQVPVESKLLGEGEVIEAP